MKHPAPPLLLVVAALWLVPGTAAANPTLPDLFPPDPMQDESTLDLRILEETRWDSRLRPGRTFLRTRFEFTSFEFAGETWRHRASMLLPDRKIPEHYRGAVAIVSQTTSLEKHWVALAEIPPILGIPCLIVESANPGARYGQSSAGLVMQSGLNRFLETGDPHWIGYTQLAKVIVRSVSAASALARTRGLTIERAVVTGHSKRGLGAWIACAVDDRIVGTMPTGYLAVDNRAFFEHKLQRWGPDYTPFEKARGPASVTVVEQIAFTRQPRWDAYERLTDPYRFQERFRGKRVLNTIGALDPLYPVTYAPEWQAAMTCDSFDQLIVSGYAHGNSSAAHKESWAAFLSNCLGNRSRTEVSIDVRRVGDEIVVTATGRSDHRIRNVTLCTAVDPTGAFLPTKTVWNRKRMRRAAGATYRSVEPAPRGEHVLAFVEVRDQDRNGIPGTVTSALIEISP